MYCPDQPINPPNSYFEESYEYDKYRCNYCGEVYTDSELIHADPLSTGNICEPNCLDGNPDLIIDLGMNDLQFEMYKEKVMKLNPINNI
jgi:hypothetical protein